MNKGWWQSRKDGLVIFAIVAIACLVITAGAIAAVKATNMIRVRDCRYEGYSDLLSWDRVRYCVKIQDDMLHGIPYHELDQEAAK